MDTDLLDDDGYPTQEILIKVTRYDVLNDVYGFLDLIKSLWSYPDRFVLEGNELYLSTGGWSGNESVIEAMKVTHFFRFAHIRWERGGHYFFDIKGFRKSNKGEI